MAFSETPYMDIDRIQARLIGLAALFVGFYALILSLSPAVRARSWQVDYRWDHWLGVAAWFLIFYLAHGQSARYLPHRDPYLLPLAALLSGWGMLTVWRLLPVFGMRQAAWLMVSVGVLIAGLRLPQNLGFLRRYKYLWLTSSLLLTGSTLLLGVNPLGYGPRMWLGCCGVYIQPSEPLKLLLIAYLAAYLADRQPMLILLAGDTSHLDDRSGFKRSMELLLPLLAPTLIMTGLALVLLIIQRDLGTAMVFLLLYAAIVYVTSGRKIILVIAFLGMVLAGLAGYGLFDVVRIRVDAWINPWVDPSGRSYQIVQSLLAVANGGLVGRGPGVGNPGLVPVAHSDLIFASIAEEHGLAGVIGLLLILALLAVRGLRAALFAPDAYRRYLAAGLTAYLVGQSLLIIGGNLRLVPLTGITLPFISYGGSSLLTTFVSLLLLLHISNQAANVPAPLFQPRPYLQLGGFLMGGLALAALAAGWWSLGRAQDLLSRTDNPRRAIADRSVRRGSILDRNNDPINATYGEPGELYRLSLYPDLSNIVGYTDPLYGQSGLEASLDGILRGEQGNPGLTTWWNRLLYGQPPGGLDVRLSLDLGLQRKADELLGVHGGAIVLLDASSGEILVMASHPGFNANLLKENWENLINDPKAPLLNRAIMGRYAAGEIEALFASSGDSASWLESPPLIRLEAGEGGEANGSGPFLSPLQTALGATAVSNQGVVPAPNLVTAMNSPLAGWVLLEPLTEARQVMAPEAAATLAEKFTSPGLGIWQVVKVVENTPEQKITWYLGGTLPTNEGRELALAVLLEQPDAEISQQIGQAMLQYVILP